MIRITLAIIISLISTGLSGQEVGLVLSGGGAKGIAHVGVIKALEENDIPIDYVVGTSMGGIVAGVYSAGYSAEQIEGIMLSPTFIKWVNGEFEEGFEYYLYSDEINAAFASIRLTLDSTLNASLNSSLASDITLNFALPEYLSKASAIANNNFDSLYVPLRIVAAEVFTQTEMVLKNNSLPLALRTTLSVPFFYKPIKIDGKYLFDGGVYNNFPIDVMQRDFNPDVIIGSNVSSKLFKEYPHEQDDRLINNSLLYMLLDKSDPSSIPESGVYIEPDLEGYTAFDFAKAKALIDSGYYATLERIDEIKTKVNKTVTTEQRTKERQEFMSKGAPMIFDQISFHGYNSKQRKYINKLFGIEKKGQLTLEDIKRSYFKMMSEKYFSTVYPDVSFKPETNTYALELHGRPQSNLNVEIGGAIATRNISQVYLGTEYYYFDNYLLRNSISFTAGAFYKSAKIKSRLYLSGFNPIYIEPEMVYNNWDFLSPNDVFLDDEQPTVLKRTDRNYALNIGLPIGTKLKAVLSGGHINNEDSYGNNLNINSSDTLDLLALTGFKGSLKIGRNNFDRKQYPSEGKALNFSFNYYNLEEAYFPGNTSITGNQVDFLEWIKFQGSWEQYFKKGRWTTGYQLMAAYSTQDVFANYLGTLINLPSFNPLQDSRTLLLQNFRAFSYASLGVKNVLSIRPNLDFRIEGYIFKPFEVLSRTGTSIGRSRADNEQVFAAASTGIVFHSPLGPISASLNYYDDAENQLGVLLHVGFMLFNDNSLGY